jgi:ribosomal protein S8
MKRITDFLDKWSTRIMFPLILIVFLKTCSTNGKIEKLEKELTKQNNKTDSIVKVETISKTEIEKMLKIEGLKAEKRMIQSTDRKILDVNRQSEIDKEIQELEK